MHTDALQVLDFWFGATDDPGHGQPREAWFRKDAAFDAEIREGRFGRRFGGDSRLHQHGGRRE